MAVRQHPPGNAKHVASKRLETVIAANGAATEVLSEGGVYLCSWDFFVFVFFNF